MAVTFHIQEVDFSLANRRVLKAWLRQLAEAERKDVGALTCIFCSDEYLLSLNKTYLEHDYYTDVITFDYSAGNVISGDIFISIDSVQANAAAYKVSFLSELYRVMAHGVLHLCGYRDATEAERKVMRAKENACLGMLPFLQSALGLKCKQAITASEKKVAQRHSLEWQNPKFHSAE